MKIIVIGGSGFIGTRLIGLLSKNIENVIINYDKVQSDSYPEITTLGDVRNIDALIEASIGADVIINLAAEHADNVTPLSLYYDVNVGGAKNVVFAAHKNNIKTIIFTSSVAIYGLNQENPDENSKIQPFNEYGRSKLSAEEVFNIWHKEVTESTLVIVRPSVVFGEDNRGNVFNLMKQIVSGKFLMIGNGQNRKSMSYVGNIAAFIVDQLVKDSGYYVFNYADKYDLTAHEIVSIIRDEMAISGINLKLPYFLGLTVGYILDFLSFLTRKKFPVSAIRIKKFCADTTINSNTAMSSGFTPPYPLEEGLRSTIRHEFK